MSELGAILGRIRRDLVEEATPLPGQGLAYGRPHEHPRNRYFPRYSKSGRRLEGAIRIGPDCPRPVKGRCECPPDGSWRPAVGVIRADALAAHAVAVPASRLRAALEGIVWVHDVYEQGPDGLWRCRWPTRRALERQRGADPLAWRVAIRLLRGEHPSVAWGEHGNPPDPETASARLLTRIERWATEERVTEWERRPRQWWDPPRKPRDPNGRPTGRSEAQSIAEHEANRSISDGGLDVTATMQPTGRVRPLPPSTAPDAVWLSNRPAIGDSAPSGYCISPEAAA